jgi:hypothetical protein
MHLRPSPATILGALAMLAGVSCGAARDDAPANVLLVVVDTLRRDHLPIHGYREHDTTPALTAFARSAGAVIEDGLIGCSSWTKPDPARACRIRICSPTSSRAPGMPPAA